MSRLLWDDPGNRRFETGLDRGVLYLPTGLGVAWNGLTSVEEDNGDIESNAFFFDGIKYMDTRYPGDFSGTMSALTYPDEFLQFDGYAELENNHVLLGHQPVYDRFGLSWRTGIGNDINGLDHGYKIHICYNLLAIPSNRVYNTLSGETNPSEFSWDISGVPEVIPGYRPTVHIILDTTRMNSFMIRDVEDLLYGTENTTHEPDPLSSLDGGTPASSGDGSLVDGGRYSDSARIDTLDGGGPEGAGTPGPVLVPGRPPTLPSLTDLVSLLNSWVLIEITDNGDGSWTATGPDDFVKMLDATTFQINSGAADYVDEDTYTVSTTHSF